MRDDERPEDKIVRLFREESKPKRRSPSKKPERPSINTGNLGSGHVIYVDGFGNCVGNNYTINLNTERVVRKTTVKTGDGVLDSQQKAELKALVSEIVSLEKAVKRKAVSFVGVWAGLNNAMKVNSYHEIAIGKFETAKKYLLQWRGRLLNTTTATKKLGPEKRNRRIAAIHARCKKTVNGEARRMAYMKAKFRVSSMTELDEGQLEQLYGYVMKFKQEGL